MVSTYSEAGVDIDASERATEALIAQIKGVNRKGDGEAIKLDNGFAGLVKLGDGALAMCTDGVGSKLLLAEEMDSIPSIPLICASIISVILVSTIFDAAPGYIVSIVISDLSMSGNCLRGILFNDRNPIMIMKLIKTIQKTGFFIKNSDIFI